MLAKHQRFLADCRACGNVSSLIGPLSALLHDHSVPHLAIDLWVALLPQVWSSLQTGEQEGIVKPIIAILSKEHNLRQQAKNPNVVQVLRL